jgi:hypothetical protein
MGFQFQGSVGEREGFVVREAGLSLHGIGHFGPADTLPMMTHEAAFLVADLSSGNGQRLRPIDDDQVRGEATVHDRFRQAPGRADVDV